MAHPILDGFDGRTSVSASDGANPLRQRVSPPAPDCQKAVAPLSSFHPFHRLSAAPDAGRSPQRAPASIVERSHPDCRKPVRRFLRFHPCHRTIGAAGGALVGSELWRGSLSDRMLIAANPCAALFVSTVSPDDRRCSAGARCRSCHRFTCPVLAPPLHGQGPLHPGSVQKAGRRMCSVIRGMLLGPSRKLLSCRATSSAFDSHFAPSGNF
jgi:hypothetical protein